MKIAILYDVIGWAFHSEALGLQKYLLKNNSKDTIDIFSYPFFYEKLEKQKKNSYDAVLLYPRQAKNITYNPKKTAVRFSSFGDYKAQKILNTDDFGHFICMNKQIESIAKKDLLNKESIISHIPVAVDTDFFFKNKNIKNNKKINIGFIGNKNRKNDEKGFSIIEETILSLENIVNFKFALYDKENRIERNDMPLFYNNLDLIICMSKQEGGPLPPFEGGACGIPTISCCTKSAINEIIKDNENGFLIERNSESLIKKILELNKNRELIKKCSKNIESLIRSEHSWQKISKNYYYIFEKLGNLK